MTNNNNNSKNIEGITGDPKKAILKISFPMMLSLALTMFYNLINSIWVSGLGPNALSAIGLITPLFMTLIGLGTGIGAGANSVISRYIGAENYKQANNTGIHAILVCILVSIIFTFIILIFIKPLLIFLNVGGALNYALDFSYIAFSFLILFTYSNVVAAIFRAEGNIKRVISVLCLSSVLNFILDPIFIYTLNLGIKGSAWATVLSVLFSSIIFSYCIWVKRVVFLDLTYKNFFFKPQLIKNIFNVAIPYILENLILAALFFIINSLVLQVSSTMSFAVCSASLQILIYAIMPANGISIAILTAAGVAYGARNPENLNTTFSYSIKLGFLFSLLTAIIMFLFSSQIASLFTYNSTNAMLRPQISQTLSLLSLYVLAYTPGVMASSLFQGVGKGGYSFILISVKSLLLESICAYIFGLIFGWGVQGIFIGLIFGCFLGSLLGFIWTKIFLHRFKKKCT